MEQFRGTTIVSVRRNGAVALGGDGQVTHGNVVMKHNACKVRRLADGALVRRLSPVQASLRKPLLLINVPLAQYWDLPCIRH